MTEPTQSAVGARAFFDRQPPPQYLEEWVERLAQPEAACRTGFAEPRDFSAPRGIPRRADRLPGRSDAAATDPCDSAPIERRSVGVGQHPGPIEDLCFGTRPARGCGRCVEPADSPQLTLRVPQHTRRRPRCECSSCTSDRNSGCFPSRRSWESTGCQRRTYGRFPRRLEKPAPFPKRSSPGRDTRSATWTRLDFSRR